jgi:choline dehydrogenase-like flavoprotein
VDKVIFDAGDAVGVRARVRGDWMDLHAGKVVLCAGSVSSPAILQRSGIGPADLLRSRGISPVADLPVGLGIQDHVGFWLSAHLEAAGAPGRDARGNVTLRYTSGTPGFGAGDILMVAANPLASQPDTAAVGVKLAQCHSRGTLRIGSADPRTAPEIQMNLLTDERDRMLGRRAARDALRMLAEAGAADVRDRHGEAIAAGIDDAALDAWLDRIATDTSHLSCSTRMGHPEAATTVVDPQARVLGIGNLFVADMSIAPMVPRANTHLTAIMIGERVSEFVAASD